MDEVNSSNTSAQEAKNGSQYYQPPFTTSFKVLREALLNHFGGFQFDEARSAVVRGEVR